MKILNCYAGIGGNRRLWGNNHDPAQILRNCVPPEIGLYVLNQNNKNEQFKLF
jgi:hypothetical protein